MTQLLLIITIILLFLSIRHVRRQPKAKRRRLTINYTLYGIIILFVGLVITGRMHWVGAAIAAALPIIAKFIPLALRFFPFLLRAKQQYQQQPSAIKEQAMDKEQAMSVFGFKNIPSKKEVIQRHRELMQKNHPDLGGSDFLAAQINEAKDILLKEANDE